MQASVKKGIYEVFAQIEPGGPISHIGNLNAPGQDLAKVYARRIYDEERWSEMWVVPRVEITVAHPDDSAPFEPKSSKAAILAGRGSPSEEPGVTSESPPSDRR